MRNGAARARMGLSILLVCAGVGAPLGRAEGQVPAGTKTKEAMGASDEDLKRAEGLYRKGIELYSAQKFGEAEAAFLEAWSIRKTYDIAANLGHAEVKLGKHVEAAGHLAFALRNWPFAGKPEPKELARKRFEEVRGKVGGLSLRVSQAGAEIFVDGKGLGVSPLEEDVFVMPGEHGVEAKLLGFETSTKKVSVSAGGTEVVEMNLAAVPAAKGTGDPKGETPKVIEVKRSRVPIFVGAGLGAVALGFGIGFTVAANNAIDEAGTQREKILAAAPPKGTPCDCLDGPEGDVYRQALERHDTMYDLAATSFALSGAAAIFSVAYALWPVKKTVLAQPRTGMVMPVFTSREQGLVWRGEF